MGKYNLLKSIIIIFVFLISLSYGEDLSIKESNLRYYEGQTKRYEIDKDELVLWKDFCDARFDRKEKFLRFSGLKYIKKNPLGMSEGEIYSDENGVNWFVKEGQSIVNEYLGSKLINLLIGPWIPEVKLIEDQEGYSASKKILKFVRQSKVKKDPSLKKKPVVGQIKLWLAMNLLRVEDNHEENFGYVNEEDRLEAARVDFDFCFEFGQDEDNEKIYEQAFSARQVEGMKAVEIAIEELVAIPDWAILKVLSEGIDDLMAGGIELDIQKHRELGPRIIKRKKILGLIYEKVQPLNVLMEAMKSEQESFTKEMFDEMESLVIEIFGRSSIFLAIEEKNLDRLKILLDHGANITETIGFRQTALHRAVQVEDLEIVKFLIEEKRMDVNAKEDYNGMTALLYAAQLGNLEMIKFLLENKAKIEATGDGKTALHFAIESENLELVKFLVIEQGMDVNAKGGYYKTTALHYATQVGNLEIMKVLLEHNADIDTKDKEGKGILYYAQAHPKIVKFLVMEKGVDVNTWHNEDMSILHYVVGWSDLELVKFLVLERNVDITAKDSDDKQTVLHWAVILEKLEMVKFLLEYNPNIINVVDKDNKTALDWAIELGAIEIAEYLKQVSKADSENKKF